MRPQVSALIAACYNAGCAPPPVGKGGSSQMGPASRSARIRSVQSRGRAVQAVKSGAKNADRQLANARKRVKATETTTNNGRRDVSRSAYDRAVAADKRKYAPQKLQDITRGTPSGATKAGY